MGRGSDDVLGTGICYVGSFVILKCDNRWGDASVVVLGQQGKVWREVRWRIKLLKRWLGITKKRGGIWRNFNKVTFILIGKFYG